MSIRLMFYDNTNWTNGLTQSWFAGGSLYRTLRFIDYVKPVDSWEEALEWLCEVKPDEKISTIQFWGHGSPGSFYINKKRVHVNTKKTEHLDGYVDELKERLAEDSMWWFRTCASFHGSEGRVFAQDWSNFFGCSAAGHTYNIGPLQSGLHSIHPGEKPSWSKEEGKNRKDGSILGSWFTAPNTITCLRGSIPRGW